MASWIFTIKGEHPEHWGYAADSGFWDIVNRKDVKAGDDIFFWQGKGSLVSWTVASDDAIDIVDSMPPAQWNDRPYVRRIPIDIVSEEPIVDISWTDLAENTGITAKPLNGQIRVPTDAEEYLRALFKPESEDSATAAGYPDTRTKISALIHRRRGQQRFRQSLLDAYDRTCAVTGSRVEDVLEAAHIRPYRGSHSHRVSNGILLRSDIHTLFDLNLLTVDEQHVVRLHPDLLDSEYGQYDGLPLRLPKSRAARPAKDNLRVHNCECSWFH
ncbi:HNH endonuclease [Gordonia malaquae]|uniref:HNH nuclease domain-containing protein n=1 Tax=Gordonia malaquae NBRC 108250 TaxID=1223542 RepID=M3VC30_GORML|nr:HNH endonuclease signature motif containing protein [Gordonia malaquae]GAC81298.1 hypothetical protein GM1_031_00510 [Gordonia malaquae NBRC 108250]SEC16511.1 HNH endonuclease [Gordonia malaquae]